MAGIAHIGLGLAAKNIAPKAPVGVLILASEAIDILWGAFALVGIENFGHSPWSHGLLMSLVWSVAGALLAALVYRDRRTALTIGLVVFSHWLLDFVTHPMFGGLPDLPLLFDGSSNVGLGLYSSIAPGFTVIIELGLVVLGLVLYPGHGWPFSKKLLFKNDRLSHE
jgi:hypothetical protein